MFRQSIVSCLAIGGQVSFDFIETSKPSTTIQSIGIERMATLSLILMSLALIFTVLKTRRSIKELKKDRDDARKMALVNKRACVIAIEEATNSKEVSEYFSALIRSGLEIGKSKGGFTDTGLTEEEALMRIYCWTEILKEWENK